MENSIQKEQGKEGADVAVLDITLLGCLPEAQQAQMFWFTTVQFYFTILIQMAEILLDWHMLGFTNEASNCT